MILPGMLKSLVLSPKLREWEARLGRPLIMEEFRLLVFTGEIEPVPDAPKLYVTNGCAEAVYEQGTT